MAIVRWFILATQFATVIPTPSIRTVSDSDIRKSVLFFPIIGGALGGALWGIQYLLTRHMAYLSAAAVSISVYSLLTGALHLDGLMDTADAVGSRRSREEALNIMKDSRIGAMGAVAAILVLLGKLTAISSVSPQDWEPFIVVPMMSRLSMIWSMAVSRSARQEGLGSFFARRVPVWVLAGATIFSGVVCILFLPLKDALWVLVYFVATVSLFNAWMVRKFGGMTGDTYGALNEIMEWVGWMVFASISQ